jgi:hypothetical protein
LRYTDQLHQSFTELNIAEITNLPLSTYVDRVIEATNQFFTDYPGYHAIFIQVQGTIPELEEIKTAADAQLIKDWANS